MAIAGTVLQLSEAQQLAIRARIDRPLVILAAAGSGKTLVLCHRILYVISQGVAAKDILAVTFTRRAAQDLLHRLKAVAATVNEGGGGPSLDGMRVGTFHSFCLSILRAFPERAGLAPNFIVFTPKMQIELVQELIKQFYSGTRKERSHGQHKNHHPVAISAEQQAAFRMETLRLLHRLRRVQNSSFVSKSSSVGLEPNPFEGDGDGGLFEHVYREYCARLQAINGIDFSSFLRYTINLLQAWPDVVQRTQVHAQHVLVDEFQDTDACQFELLRTLCEQHQSLTVVGDDDQQIYSWRGAAGLVNLAKFESAFSGATTVKLEQNFRSTGAIVAAARSVIKRNKFRADKTIRTMAQTGPLLTVCECRNEQCEAASVANFIKSLEGQGVPLHEIAVLYRLQRVGLELRENLQARGIHCDIKGSGSVDGSAGTLGKGFETTGAAFEDVLVILRLVINEADDLACKHLMNLVCPPLTAKISAYLRDVELMQGLPLLNALKCTRSHLLGTLDCGNLSSFRQVEDQKCTETEKSVLKGMHNVLKIVSSTRDDVQQNLKMRDVVMNVLQQISPYREAQSQRGSTYEHASQEAFELSQRGDGLAFAGVKSLLKEAAIFDLQSRNSVNESQAVAQGIKEIRPGSYMDIKRRKGGRGSSSRSLYSATHVLPSTISQVDRNLAMENLKLFLDQVTIRLHEHELGESHSIELTKEKLSTFSEKPATQSSDSMNCVTLSTIHQAKGLEWTAVILVHVNEGIIPVMDCASALGETSTQPVSEMVYGGALQPNPQPGIKCLQGVSSKSTIHVLEQDRRGTAPNGMRVDFDSSQANDVLAEERRLMYVGLTRAKRYLLITYVVMAGGQPHLRSRFLADIPKGLTQKAICYDSSLGTGTEVPAHFPSPQKASVQFSDRRGLLWNIENESVTRRALRKCSSAQTDSNVNVTEQVQKSSDCKAGTTLNCLKENQNQIQPKPSAKVGSKKAKKSTILTEQLNYHDQSLQSKGIKRPSRTDQVEAHSPNFNPESTIKNL